MVLYNYSHKLSQQMLKTIGDEGEGTLSPSVLRDVSFSAQFSGPESWVFFLFFTSDKDGQSLCVVVLIRDCFYSIYVAALHSSPLCIPITSTVRSLLNTGCLARTDAAVPLCRSTADTPAASPWMQTGY